MHQLFGAIGVACTWLILSSGCAAAPQAPNVEHLYRYMGRLPQVYAFNFHPSRSFMTSVPMSRSQMAGNAAPFQPSAYKNPLLMRSLMNSVAGKFAANKRFDIPNTLTPPGAHLGPPPGAYPLYLPQQSLPQHPQQVPYFGQGLALPQYQAAQQLPAPLPLQGGGNPLTPEEFQQYLKAAAAPAPPSPKPASATGEYLSQDDFQKYLKLATKKNKVNGPVLSPEEFQKFVLAAQDARDQALIKSGKPRPNKLQTLTPEDFKKFFAANKDKGITGPGQFKKHKRGGHYSSSSTGESSFSSSGSSGYSDHSAHPPKYGSNPPPEAYPDFYSSHHIETEDQATKRSVLDALWRAFQAITGGALTIGGHLARGGGAILQAKGKLIASAGPVVTDFGKTIATKAVAPPPYAPSYSHGTPYHYSHPEESHGSHSSLLQTALDVASSLKVAALGTTKAVADLISELSNASAKAYLLKE